MSKKIIFITIMSISCIAAIIALFYTHSQTFAYKNFYNTISQTELSQLKNLACKNKFCAYQNEGFFFDSTVRKNDSLFFKKFVQNHDCNNMRISDSLIQLEIDNWSITFHPEILIINFSKTPFKTPPSFEFYDSFNNKFYLAKCITFL